jgi:hypothetical protein
MGRSGLKGRIVVLCNAVGASTSAFIDFHVILLRRRLKGSLVKLYGTLLHKSKEKRERS